MVMKKILLINGHPRQGSFCDILEQHYIEGAKSQNAEVKTLSLRNLNLEPWLNYGWEANHDSVPLSEALLSAQELITWCNHIVFVFPTYWSAPPALLKLFLEVIIVSKFAFKYHKPRQLFFGKLPIWDKLLKGKTASIISTMDTYPLIMYLILKDPVGKMMYAALGFTGIQLKHKYYFGSVKLSADEKRKKWLLKAYRIGQKESKN
jgi:NAD(P)H dehydrogenase (quinone)